MRQSTIFFIVAALVLIWFGAEAFPGQQICAMSCVSLAGMNFAEQAAAVAILPILIALGGYSLRKSEKQKELAASASSPKTPSQAEGSPASKESATGTSD
jgi:membrane protein implicated in regulation of membrane protease activity